MQEDSTGKYNVKLSRDPLNGVTIHVSSPDSAVTVDSSDQELAFTANIYDIDDGMLVEKGTWDAWQEVMVTAERDANAVEEKVVLEHRWNVATGPVVKTVTVNVDELDKQGVTVSKTDLEVAEGASNTYSLSLQSKTRPRRRFGNCDDKLIFG